MNGNICTYIDINQGNISVKSSIRAICKYKTIVCFAMECINNSYIEAARVYFKQNEQNTIAIKCVLCNTGGLLEWSSFLRHLSARHSIVGISPRGPNIELDDEIRTEVELELQNLSNGFNYEDENDVFSEAESEGNKTDVEDVDEQEDAPESNEV